MEGPQDQLRTLTTGWWAIRAPASSQTPRPQKPHHQAAHTHHPEEGQVGRDPHPPHNLPPKPCGLMREGKAESEACRGDSQRSVPNRECLLKSSVVAWLPGHIGSCHGDLDPDTARGMGAGAWRPSRHLRQGGSEPT